MEVWKWIVKDTLKESYIPGMYNEIMKKHVSPYIHVQCRTHLHVYS